MKLGRLSVGVRPVAGFVPTVLGPVVGVGGGGGEEPEGGRVKRTLSSCAPGNTWRATGKGPENSEAYS